MNYFLHAKILGFKHPGTRENLKFSSNLPEDLEKSMLMMKKQYPLYHNNICHKKPNIIGPDWKMYPHLVNKGR